MKRNYIPTDPKLLSIRRSRLWARKGWASEEDRVKHKRAVNSAKQRLYKQRKTVTAQLQKEIEDFYKKKE